MSLSAELYYDAASAQSQGRRDQQEDAVAADFPAGAGMGFAVLADGMGGHAAGDVASKIVVTEIFSELKMRAGDPGNLEQSIGAVLRNAVRSANDCVRYHAQTHPETVGMGSTLVAPVLLADRLFWISVGDSPLYLFREGELIRLNEDHSMLPQIEYMVSQGLIDSQSGEAHPDRNCLTSVLIGDEIAHIDCPAEPIRLKSGDIVLVASDGLQFLPDNEIAAQIKASAGNSSAEISAGLLRMLERLDDPEQDNISLCVIKVAERPAQIVSAAPALLPAAALGEPVIKKRDGVAFMAARSKSKKIVTYRVTMEKSA